MSVYDLIPGAQKAGRTLGWHFCAVNDNEELVLRDGTVVTRENEGKWLPPLTPELCSSGYHASEKLSDALSYAPDGRSLALVELGGEIIRGSDKLCAATRRVLARIDIHPLLVDYANDCAADFARRGLDKFVKALEDGIAANDRAAVEKLLDAAPDLSENKELFARFERAVESATMGVLDSNGAK